MIALLTNERRFLSLSFFLCLFSSWESDKNGKVGVPVSVIKVFVNGKIFFERSYLLIYGNIVL